MHKILIILHRMFSSFKSVMIPIYLRLFICECKSQIEMARLISAMILV